jgi:hypothetical protein
MEALSNDHLRTKKILIRVKVGIAACIEMRESDDSGTGTYLSDGHVNLAILPLEPERETEGPYLKEGFYHFGFQVDDVDALRPIRRRRGLVSFEARSWALLP